MVAEYNLVHYRGTSGLRTTCSDCNSEESHQTERQIKRRTPITTKAGEPQVVWRLRTFRDLCYPHSMTVVLLLLLVLEAEM